MSAALPVGWTLVGGDLISVCSWCVEAGDVPAPPMDLRTDSICPRHADEFLHATRVRKAARDLAFQRGLNHALLKALADEGRTT